MPLSDAEIEIAGRLKHFREAQKIKQLTIAEGSKTRQGQLSEMEQGKKQVQPRVVLFLAERYSLNVDWLFTGRGEMFVETAAERVSEPAVRYGRSSFKLLEKQIRDLETRIARMEGNEDKGK